MVKLRDGSAWSKFMFLSTFGLPSCDKVLYATTKGFRQDHDGLKPKLLFVSKGPGKKKKKQKKKG